MQQLRFRCRVCKRTTMHTTSQEYGVLPDGMVLVECHSCEVVGIENLANEIKSASQGLKDELKRRS